MAGFMTDNVTAAFNGDGDSEGIGYVSVADTTGFQVGATVTLRGDTVVAATYQVAAVDSVATRIGVRAVVIPGTGHFNTQNYGLTSVAQYTVADNAKIVQPSQFIYAAYTQ